MSCSMTAEYIVSILVMTISVVEVHRTDSHALSNEYMIIINFINIKYIYNITNVCLDPLGVSSNQI